MPALSSAFSFGKHVSSVRALVLPVQEKSTSARTGGEYARKRQSLCYVPRHGNEASEKPSRSRAGPQALEGAHGRTAERDCQACGSSTLGEETKGLTPAMALSPKMLAVLKKADAANAEYFAGLREKAQKQKQAEAREKTFARAAKARAKKKAR